MKRKLLSLLTTLALALSLVGVGDVTVKAESSEDYEVIYRMYNPNSGEHFYTKDTNERLSLYLNGWEAEGIGWVAPASSSTPIYRLYSGVEHHYTFDTNEVAYLEANGWSNEGIRFYSDDNQSVPMYRVFNPMAIWTGSAAGAHHFTVNTNERDTLVGYGWNDEGIAWYTLNVDTSSIAVPDLPEKYANNITNTESYATLETDVKLSGWGTGHHAKLLYQTPTAAVSFGIQYDMWAAAPYTNTTYFMCENVASNDIGGQNYYFFNYTEKDIYHHLMMTCQRGGLVSFYVDGNMIGQVWNPYLEQGPLYCSVEGAARLDGDNVTADFRNIRVKTGGVYDSSKYWQTFTSITNPGMSASVTGFDWGTPNTGTVNISGTITGLGGLDWDSAYDRVSGVVRFGGPLY